MSKDKFVWKVGDIVKKIAKKAEKEKSAKRRTS